MKLLIVESPTKAKTISKFLDKSFSVLSSKGHIRDLPENGLGIDIEHNFEPTYVIPPAAKPTVKTLQAQAKRANEIYFATDEDREGEAISWHLAQVLKIAPASARRIVFHEITKPAILRALETPRHIDSNLVDAQQARRILDRIVGYKLSPFLWKKVARGLSAGRVQSAAMRLIAAREDEIKKFKPQDYWAIYCLYQGNLTFKAELVKISGKVLKKLELDNAERAEKIVEELRAAEHKVASVQTVLKKRAPYAPFTTSTLQQEASHYLGFSAKQTMVLAQQLYEGIATGSEGHTGLITYMRTDSRHLASEAVGNIRDYIDKELGKEYLPAQSRVYLKQQKGAQEAHEAIRPTSVWRTPSEIQNDLDPRQFKLYKLIWERTVACQCADAIFASTKAEIVAADYGLRANGSTLKFDGFLRIYPNRQKDELLPSLRADDKLALDKAEALKKTTEPPARYSEAALIKALEEEGIGRPSTYAPTISTIISRGYVEKNLEDKKLHPTDIGLLVDKVLFTHFPNIVDLKFTATMEANLDRIAEGELKWQPTIKEFYEPFISQLAIKEKEVNKKDLTEEATDEVCDKCGKPMVIKTGRFGRFYACTGYPDCKNTKPLPGEAKDTPQITDQVCEKCGKPMVVKRGRFGAFLGCSGYPECKSIKSIEKKTGLTCPKCKQGDVIEKKSKRGRKFYGCNQYPKCDYVLWNAPTGELCPNCKQPKIWLKQDRDSCSNPACPEYKK